MKTVMGTKSKISSRLAAFASTINRPTPAWLALAVWSGVLILLAW